jgi:membrane-associated phospholipid phosphatase
VLGVAVLITQVGVSEVKAAVDRPRPAGSLVATLHAAYPSGHAAQAIIYLWLALLVALRARVAIGAAAMVLALLVVIAVGFTRIYLRAHFFTDVMGGWAFGLVAFAIPATVALLLRRVGNNQSDAAPAR